MARYASMVPTWTPVAVADTTNMTDAGHHTLQGGGASLRAEMRRIQLAGQASSSAVAIMAFGRTSQVATGTLTAARIAALETHATAPGTLVSPHTGSATNKSQRSSTLGMLLNMTFNCFGGRVEWLNGPDEIISMFGVAELSLNAFTGGSPGAISSNLVFDIC